MGFLDHLETRPTEVRLASQVGALPGLVMRAIERAEGWAKHLEGVDPLEISSMEALAGLPVMRKADLVARQSESPPFGGLAATPMQDLARVFVSPGPIYEPQGQAADFWRAARALNAAGFRRGEVVHNTFSYHLTPGGWVLDQGARALGCVVIPAGVGNTEQQLDAIHHLRPTAYTGVPDFLKVLLDKGAEAGRDMTSITKASVGGGPLFPSLREEYRTRGIQVTQSYATADLGVIAYESVVDGAPTPGMIVDEGVIVEIVRPGTGDPLPEGEVGEVVVTLFNRDYPLIRFATGDMSAVLPGSSPCGRTNMRIKGWMGRADQTTKIKGMFVHPGQIAAVARRHGELVRTRLVVTRDNEQDVMTLLAEAKSSDPALGDAVAQTLRDVTKLRGEVRIVAVDTLPKDGIVISDERKI